MLLSLALHAGISVWILNTEFEFEADPARDRVVSLSLLPARPEPVPEPEPRNAPDPAPEPQPRPPEPEPPENSNQTRQAAAEPAVETVPAETDPSPPATSTEPAELLTARVLEQVRQQHAPDPAARERPAWTQPGAPVAGLPGYRGWLAGYVGEVAPSSDQWQASDGAREARHVLPDGTVVCTRRRAPTAEELIHPMRAMIVTMARICGQERPAGPDYGDPNVRPPPGRSPPE